MTLTTPPSGLATRRAQREASRRTTAEVGSCPAAGRLLRDASRVLAKRRLDTDNGRACRTPRPRRLDVSGWVSCLLVLDFRAAATMLPNQL